MAIHLSILQPRLAEGGKIKIGGLGRERTAQSGRKTRLPERYNHFVITKTVRSGDGENFVVDYDLMNTIMDGDPTTFVRDDAERHKATRGRKLVRVPILLESDVIDEVLPTRLAAYWGTRLFCTGTGDPQVPATRTVFEKDGKRSGTKKRPCPCDFLHEEIKGVQCKPNGTLWATIVAGRNTTLGIRHSFRTTSWNSIRSMLASLQTIQKRVGTLVNVPLYLVLREERVKDRNDKVRRIHVAHIELLVHDLAALRQLQREALEAVNLRNQVSTIAGRPVTLGLPAPGATNEPTAEQKRVAQEFYPPQGGDSESDESTDDGIIDYDPETGEVFETPPDDDFADPPSPEPEDQRPPSERGAPHDHEPPIDTTATEKSTAPPEPDETKSPPTDEGASENSASDRVPDDHPLRASVVKLLDQVAMDRDFSAEDMKRGRNEIWAEACQAIGSTVAWKDLTFLAGYQMEEQLTSMLRSED